MRRVHVAKLGALALLAVSGLGGCFDVSATNLRVIDNFNDDDLLPTDPDFGTWGCMALNPSDNPNVDCRPDNDTEDGSAFSLRLDVMVMDPADGLQQHGGAAALTKALPPVTVDFTRFGRIAFDLKVQSGGDNPLPANALLYVELYCSTVLPELGERHDLYVSQGVPYTSDWHNFALSLVNFGPPAALAEPIEGGPAACLRHVDQVRFSLDAQLPDGKPGEAILHFDNIVLE